MKIPITALGLPAVAEEHSIPAPQTCDINPIIKTTFFVVDLFAGCGGLGEGFATFESRPGQHPFHIIASVEKEPSACRTLRLRSFYHRLVQIGDPSALTGYYAYVRGEQKTPVSPVSDLARVAWQQAEEETLERTLGDPDTGSALKTLIHRAQKNADRPLVLIGGPPCQAYSSVGRVRNAGIDGYRPALDHRHFLYRVYLELLSNHQPVAFVMENVKGILSSRIDGRRLFPRILQDLASPAEAYGQDKRRRHPHYRIYSLVDGSSFRHGQDPASIQPERFIVQAERYGIPQNRHRVILFGLREDLANQFDRQGGVFPCLCPLTDSSVTVRPVLADLPPLHSGLSWLRSAYPVGDRRETLLALFDRFAAMIEDMELRSAFEQAARQVTGSNQPQGGRSGAVRHSESGGNMETPCRNLTVRKVARL
jgi:DNA (cytosine-5)-methyltransferase 1